MNSRTTPRPARSVLNDRRGSRAGSVGQLACLLEQRGLLGSTIRELTDQDTDCVCRALVMLATTGEVATSTVALDLRVWQLAGELRGRPVGLARVRQVRRAVQRRGGLAIEISGVRVLPVGSAGSDPMQVARRAQEPAEPDRARAEVLGGDAAGRAGDGPGVHDDVAVRDGPEVGSGRCRGSGLSQGR